MLTQSDYYPNNTPVWFSLDGGKSWQPGLLLYMSVKFIGMIVYRGLSEDGETFLDKYVGVPSQFIRLQD